MNGVRHASGYEQCVAFAYRMSDAANGNLRVAFNADNECIERRRMFTNRVLIYDKS